MPFTITFAKSLQKCQSKITRVAVSKITILSGGLRFGGPVQKIWGALSYVDPAKIFRPLQCENVVTATCFVHIRILIGTYRCQCTELTKLKTSSIGPVGLYR